MSLMRLILLSCLVISSCQGEQLVRREVTTEDSPRSACNDGSRPVFYHSPGEPASRQFLVHLEGGYFCSSLASCRERCDTLSYYCTTDKSPTVSRYGIFSSDRNRNKFADFYKVFIHYCSSDMHLGDSGPSAETGDMYFRGRANVHGVFESLKSLVGLGEGDRVLFSGSSAGGRGSAMLCNAVAEMLPGVRVSCVVEAAIFYPEFSDGNPFQTDCQPFNARMREAGRYWNGSLEDFDVATWWVDFPQPLFISEFVYDNYSFLYHCIDDQNADHLRTWADGMRQAAKDLQHRAPHVGLFLPGCRGHPLMAFDHYFYSARVGPARRTLMETMYEWFTGEEGGATQVWDDCSAVGDADECSADCIENNYWSLKVLINTPKTEL